MVARVLALTGAIMRVLVFEPQFLGHNLAHAARVVRELATLPCDVILATSRQAAESQEFAVQFSGLEGLYSTKVIDTFRFDSDNRSVRTTGLSGARAAYSALRQALVEIKPEHVFVPYGNVLARIAFLPAGLSRRLEATGAEAETLLVGGRYALPPRDWQARLRQRISFNLLARGPWSSVFHLDPRAVNTMQQHSPQLARRAKLMPEPVALSEPLSRLQARRLLGIPEEGRCIVVTGLIELRKGIDILASALGDLRGAVRLVLAGKCDAATRAWLEARCGDELRTGRILCLDRYLSQREFHAAVYAADVVAAVYPRHLHSSSVVVAAAAAERPVLGADSGWIGNAIDSFDLGLTCQPHDLGDVTRALRQSLAMADRFRLSPRGERFVTFNSESNFGAHWTRRLRERMGLAQSPSYCDWSRVIAPVELAPLRRAA